MAILYKLRDRQRRASRDVPESSYRIVPVEQDMRVRVQRPRGKSTASRVDISLEERKLRKHLQDTE